MALLFYSCFFELSAKKCVFIPLARVLQYHGQIASASLLPTTQPTKEEHHEKAHRHRHRLVPAGR